MTPFSGSGSSGNSPPKYGTTLSDCMMRVHVIHCSHECGLTLELRLIYSANGQLGKAYCM